MAESAEAKAKSLLPLLARIKYPVGVTISELTYGTAVHLTIRNVTKMNLYDTFTGINKNPVPNSIYVQSVTDDGNNLTWIIGY